MLFSKKLNFGVETDQHFYLKKKFRESTRRQKEILIFAEVAHFSIVEIKYFDISDTYFSLLIF